MFELPHAATALIEALESRGYEAWAVGGWVRDKLLGLPDHDCDVCTDALWEQVADVARAQGWAVHETGTAHGTVTVVVDGTAIETTTYRSDGVYSDMRHPDEVRFVRDIQEDLARRDFTVNAMAYHPTRGLFDPFDGAKDLEDGLIRCVGKASERFEEDALRVLRAVRFAARLGFNIEPETQAALDAAAHNLVHIAHERIGMEMDGILATGRGAWALMHQTVALVAAIPELGPMVGFDQRSPYHAYDVLEHTAHVMEATEELTAGLASQELRWAALLHDVAKPDCFNLDPDGRGHFFGHPGTGAEKSELLMRRMALPLDVIRPCTLLIKQHDYMIHPTEKSLKKALRRIDAVLPGRAYAVLHELLVLKRADAMSKNPQYKGYAFEIDDVERVLRRLRRERTAINVRELAISGKDVMEVTGMEPGPAIGRVLDDALDAVMAGKLANERDALRNWLSRR